ncbi:MAG: hypothetical protein PF487_08995 [Bacteroidales bacterium]|jgi:hypothetical protein|nr:hypothetical protein [Bacteroidales bacterium]
MEPIKATGVSYKCGNLFYEFSQNNIGVSDLIKGLREAEEVMKNKNRQIEDGGLWFRFFDGDPEATTIENIKEDLSLPHSHPNKSYMVEKIGITVEDPDSVIGVYFS